MNKAELINAAAEKADLSKKDTESAINAAIEVIAACLAEGDKVQLVGFGAFEVKDRAARIVRNPGAGGRRRVRPHIPGTGTVGTDGCRG